MDRMYRWSGISVFVEAVERGSFSAAADQLHLSRSAIGKAVAKLEEQLGVRLFHRTTRRQSLTAEAPPPRKAPASGGNRGCTREEGTRLPNNPETVYRAALAKPPRLEACREPHTFPVCPYGFAARTGEGNGSTPSRELGTQ
ncbi:MAG TPA: LysR family transcriptional regulator [Arenicellales bacterium]|nr:LysR family transcriptional regulator [Arenicellales bacterium]